MKQELQQLSKRIMCMEQLLEKLIHHFGEKDIGMGKEKPLSLKQAADFLHLSVSRMYSLIYEKKLFPVQRTSRSKILFTQQELNRFLIKSQSGNCKNHK